MGIYGEKYLSCFIRLRTIPEQGNTRGPKGRYTWLILLRRKVEHYEAMHQWEYLLDKHWSSHIGPEQAIMPLATHSKFSRGKGEEMKALCLSEALEQSCCRHAMLWLSACYTRTYLFLRYGKTVHNYRTEFSKLIVIRILGIGSTRIVIK